MSTISSELPDAHSRPALPSAWSAPRPDGPLAQALREAEAERLRIAAAQPARDDEWDDPLPADMQPLPDPEGAKPASMADDIEALAREARAHDDEREALAIALEWPATAALRKRRVGSWVGWAVFAAVLILAGVAAIAVLAPRDRAPLSKPQNETLKLERQLSMPPNPRGAGAGP
jgi:hypothetical protein